MSSNKDKVDILSNIVARKHSEVDIAKQRTPVYRLEESEQFLRKCYSMKEFVTKPELSGIIAEYKRKSPSKGIINDKATVKDVTRSYVAAGASCLSVLTDRSFFGGRKGDLLSARKYNQIPILRKDFMLTEYQIIESKSLGADIILLIAAILSPAQIESFARLSRQLGMSVLLEVHSLEELKRSLCDNLDAIGVNNRNLGDFSVSIDHSYELVSHIPTEVLKISESGISNPATILELKEAGFDGFLIGENFMKTENPGLAMKNFVQELQDSKV